MDWSDRRQTRSMSPPGGFGRHSSPQRPDDEGLPQRCRSPPHPALRRSASIGSGKSPEADAWMLAKAGAEAEADLTAALQEAAAAQQVVREERSKREEAERRLHITLTQAELAAEETARARRLAAEATARRAAAERLVSEQRQQIASQLTADTDADLRRAEGRAEAAEEEAASLRKLVAADGVGSSENLQAIARHSQQQALLWQEEAKRLTEEVTKQAGLLAEAKAETAVLRDQGSAAAARAGELEEEVRVLRLRLSRNEGGRDAGSAQDAAMRAELSGAWESVANATRGMDLLRAELSAAHAMREQAEAELGRVRDEMAGLRSEALRDDVRQGKAEQAELADALLLSSPLAASQAAAAQTRQLVHAEAQLRSAKRELKETAEMGKKKEAELIRQRREAGGLAAEVAALRQDLTSALRGASDARDRCAAAERAGDALRADNSALRAALEQERSAVTATVRDATAAAAAAAASALGDAETARVDARQARAESEQAEDMRRAAAQEAAIWEQQAAAAERLRDDAAGAAAESHQAAETLGGEVARLKEQLAEVCARARVDEERSMAEAAAKSAELAACREEVAASSTEAAGLRKEMAQLRADVQRLQAETARLDAAAKDEQNRADRASAELDALARELDDARATRHRLEQEMRVKEVHEAAQEVRRRLGQSGREPAEAHPPPDAEEGAAAWKRRVEWIERDLQQHVTAARGRRGESPPPASPAYTRAASLSSASTAPAGLSSPRRGPSIGRGSPARRALSSEPSSAVAQLAEAERRLRRLSTQRSEHEPAPLPHRTSPHRRRGSPARIERQAAVAWAPPL